MKKKWLLRVGILIVISLASLGIFCLLGQFGISLIIGVLCAISIISFISLYFAFKNDKILYKIHLKKILDDYRELLIESSTMPNLEDKKVVIVGSIEELIEVRKHLKKSIYYNKELDCCAFFILDSDEVCIYILKVNAGIISNLETIMEEVNNKNNVSKVFSAIDGSTVIKLENSRVFKISTKEAKIDFEEEEEII